MRNYTQVFFGKTEVDIDDQFAEWQRDNAGFVFNIKRHPTQSLEMKSEAATAFGMIVDY